jgi:ParB/RepB/Spo0J family partition protein
MALKDQRTGRKDILMVPPLLLSVDPVYNVRKINPKDPDFLELKESIRANGVREPLTIRTERTGNKEVFYIIAGHRRYTAVAELLAEGVEIKAVPVRSVKMGQEELVLDLILSNSGQPLNQIEQGEVFHRLQGMGWMPMEIAAKTGKSGQHITNCLALYALHPDAKAKVFEGKISASQLLDMSKKHGEGEALVKKVTEAVDNAAKAGKAKVTAKTVAGGKPTLKKEHYEVLVKGIWEAADLIGKDNVNAAAKLAENAIKKAYEIK